MKDMRQLINLMENVMAVPGLSPQESHEEIVRRAENIVSSLMREGHSLESAIETAYGMENSHSWALALDQVMHDFMKNSDRVYEKSSSEKQARFMAAAAHDPKFAKKVGIDQDVAKEFNKADTGTELLSKAAKNKEESCSMEEAHVDTCRQSNGAPARDACAMEGADSEITDDMVQAAYQARHEAFAKDLPNKYQLADYASMLANKFAQQQSIKNHGKGFDPMSGNLLPENLNNGYDDVNVVDGQDFFPNGADGPVVKKVGPSGARQGDNPEQKKMQVDETHKELVYAYRKYLKESATADSKKKLNESTQQVVSGVEIQDYDLKSSINQYHTSIETEGTLSAEARVLSSSGQPLLVGYDLKISANADIGEESDESPTGWNYKTDNPTYTSYTTYWAETPKFQSIEYDPQGYYIIDNSDEVSFEEFKRLLHPLSLKGLLDPKLYEGPVGKLLDKEVENADRSSYNDYDPPDRD